jgi:hypothetical protein
MRLMAGKNLCDEHHQQRQLDESFDHLSDCLEEPRSYAQWPSASMVTLTPSPLQHLSRRTPDISHPLFKMCAKQVC